MSKFFHAVDSNANNNDVAKAAAIPQVFQENSQANKPKVQNSRIKVSSDSLPMPVSRLKLSTGGCCTV